MIQSFAAARNYTVEFVLTPWANLSSNLRLAGSTTQLFNFWGLLIREFILKVSTFGLLIREFIILKVSAFISLGFGPVRRAECLVAAGGITWTQKRAEEFLVSVPLEPDRKVPIFASRSTQRFEDFKDFDREGVSIIENHGGTNEKYAHVLFQKGLLTKPVLDIAPSNQEAYACLRECSARPLVMFTDSIEVDFLAGQPGSTFSDKGLRMAMPDIPAFESHKVFLARNTSAGAAILQELNKFLVDIKSDGRYELWKRKAFSTKYPSPSATCPLQALCTEGAELYRGGATPRPGLLLL